MSPGWASLQNLKPRVHSSWRRSSSSETPRQIVQLHGHRMQQGAPGLVPQPASLGHFIGHRAAIAPGGDIVRTGKARVSGWHLALGTGTPSSLGDCFISPSPTSSQTPPLGRSENDMNQGLTVWRARFNMRRSKAGHLYVALGDFACFPVYAYRISSDSLVAFGKWGKERHFLHLIGDWMWVS